MARAKLVGCELANKVGPKAVQSMGGYGVSKEYHIIRRLKDALQLFSAAGTQKIMKATIGRSIMA